MESRDEGTFDEANMEVETEETSDATLALDGFEGFEVLGGDCSINCSINCSSDCSSTSFIDTKASKAKGSKSDQLNKEDTNTTEAVRAPIKRRQID